MIGKNISICLLTLCFIFSLTLPAIEYCMEKGIIRATDQGKILWENRHDRLNRVELAYKTKPVQSGLSLYYCIGSYLYEVSPTTGIVQKRIVLPGFCNRMEKTDQGILIEVCSFQKEFTWKKQYAITPQEHNISFYLTAYLSQAMMDKNDAKAVSDEILKNAPKAESNILYLEKAISSLEEYSKRDPSNLWYIMQQGMHLWELGKKTEAFAKFQQTLQSPSSYHLSLLSMVHTLDTYQMTLGNEAFEKAARFLIAQGYEPELMNALISMMILYGRPLGDRKDGEKDISYLNQLGQRIWDISPYAEASCYMYHALAIANKKSGDMEKAKLWEKRREEATPYRIFGGANLPAEKTGHFISLLCAISTAIFFLIFIKALRIPKNPKKPFANIFFFRFWSKGELIGFLLLIVAEIFSFYSILIGLSAISYTVSMPLSCLNGFLHHPDAMEYFQRAANSESKDFINAFSLQKLHQEQAADEIYQKFDSAQAWNNRGVIAYNRCDREAARLLFQKALQKDPSFTIAAFNLGENVSCPRIERMIKYGAKAPLLAIPTKEQWSDMASGTPPQFSLKQLFSLLSHVGDENRIDTGFVLICYFSLFFIFILSIGAFVALFLPEKEAPAIKNRFLYYFRKTFEVIFPGSSREWNFAGPFVLTCFFFSLIVLYMLYQTNGLSTNILDALAIPNVQNIYGISEIFLSPLSQFVIKANHLWWILLLLNILMLYISGKKTNFSKKD